MRVLKKNAIKAYKAFNWDWTCRGFKYEVGKTYHHKGRVEKCIQGFHSCVHLVRCYEYYDYSADPIIAEVLVWGEVQGDKHDKLCSSDITIVRELSREEINELSNIGESNTGYGNVGNGNYGSYNTGHRNQGRSNSSVHTKGDYNTGSWCVGNYNTGYLNIGNHNTGYRNIGEYNAGFGNVGNNNTGNHNRGNCNTGSWNRCNGSAGYFCTTPCPSDYWFNKKTSVRAYTVPEFLCFDLTEWVDHIDMTEKEKAEYDWDVVGGYLKRHTYKSAARKELRIAKNKSNWKEQLALLKALPNFDYAIFEEITGITKKDLES